MIQVARDGKVILTLDSLEDLRAEVEAGRVFPTDHYIAVGMPSWHLVSALPATPVTFAAREPEPEAAAKAAVRAQLETIRAQIQALIGAPSLPRPACCKLCGAPDLRSAKLVWQQSTKVGGAIDTNLDITVFGTSSLQGLDVSPPPEPRMPAESSGGCLTMVASFFTFVFVFDFVFLPFMLGAEHFRIEDALGGRQGFPFRALSLAYLALAVYLAFLAARALYRWDKRRSGKTLDGDCAVQLERAKIHTRWRNTWICMSCGGKTIAVRAAGPA